MSAPNDRCAKPGCGRRRFWEGHDTVWNDEPNDHAFVEPQAAPDTLGPLPCGTCGGDHYTKRHEDRGGTLAQVASRSPTEVVGWLSASGHQDLSAHATKGTAAPQSPGDDPCHGTYDGVFRCGHQVGHEGPHRRRIAPQSPSLPQPGESIHVDGDTVTIGLDVNRVDATAPGPHGPGCTYQGCGHPESAHASCGRCQMDCECDGGFIAPVAADQSPGAVSVREIAERVWVSLKDLQCDELWEGLKKVATEACSAGLSDGRKDSDAAIALLRSTPPFHSTRADEIPVLSAWLDRVHAFLSEVGHE